MMTPVIALAAGLLFAPAAGAAVAWIASPTGNLSCEMAERHQGRSHVSCQSVNRPLTVRMSAADTRLRVCRGVRCLGDPPADVTVTLRYGRSRTVGRYRCTSLRTGMRCVDLRRRTGFLIHRAGYRTVTLPRAAG